MDVWGLDSSSEWSWGGIGVQVVALRKGFGVKWLRVGAKGKQKVVHVSPTPRPREPGKKSAN